MQATKHGYETNLVSNIRPQVQSLFIGAVINETSLIDYANTKRLIGYTNGYTLAVLTNMQSKINSVKLNYPKEYGDYRRELLYQISNQKTETIFFICDRYINSFLNISLVTNNHVWNAFSRFSSSYNDRY